MVKMVKLTIIFVNLCVDGDFIQFFKFVVYMFLNQYIWIWKGKEFIYTNQWICKINANEHYLRVD